MSWKSSFKLSGTHPTTPVVHPEAERESAKLITQERISHQLVGQFVECPVSSVRGRDRGCGANRDRDRTTPQSGADCQATQWILVVCMSLQASLSLTLRTSTARAHQAQQLFLRGSRRMSKTSLLNIWAVSRSAWRLRVLPNPRFSGAWVGWLEEQILERIQNCKVPGDLLSVLLARRSLRSKEHTGNTRERSSTDPEVRDASSLLFPSRGGGLK